MPNPLFGFDNFGSRRVSVTDIQKAKLTGRHWPALTCYDALTAAVFDDAGIPVMLVGDSAAMVVYGHSSTLPVSMDELIGLTAAVVRGSSRAMIIADMPFGSYQESVPQALHNATRFMKEAGAHAVKLEGGRHVLAQVEALVAAGIPVMGHLGLTPQSVHALGGYRVQGRGEAGDVLKADAKALAAVGAFGLVLEAVPASLAAEVTAMLDIPTVGIGAGADTDAQILVWQDLVGLSPDPAPKFVKRYADMRSVLSEAVHTWSDEVCAGTFPDVEHQYI